jgi:hypothetical protein
VGGEYVVAYSVEDVCSVRKCRHNAHYLIFYANTYALANYSVVYFVASIVDKVYFAQF